MMKENFLRCKFGQNLNERRKTVCPLKSVRRLFQGERTRIYMFWHHNKRHVGRRSRPLLWMCRIKEDEYFRIGSQRCSQGPCGSQNNDPQICLHSNFWSCEYVMLHGKREFRLQMGLRLLVSWFWDEEIMLDYLGEHSIITNVFRSKIMRQESQCQSDTK